MKLVVAVTRDCRRQVVDREREKRRDRVINTAVPADRGTRPADKGQIACTTKVAA